MAKFSIVWKTSKEPKKVCLAVRLNHKTYLTKNNFQQDFTLDMVVEKSFFNKPNDFIKRLNTEDEKNYYREKNSYLKD